MQFVDYLDEVFDSLLSSFADTNKEGSAEMKATTTDSTKVIRGAEILQLTEIRNYRNSTPVFQTMRDQPGHPLSIFSITSLCSFSTSFAAILPAHSEKHWHFS